MINWLFSGPNILLMPLTSLIMGIIAQLQLTLSAPILGVICILTCPLLVCRKKKLQITSACLLIASIGAFLFTHQQQANIAPIKPYLGKKLDIKGLILDKEALIDEHHKELIRLAITDLKQSDSQDWQKTSCVIWCYLWRSSKLLPGDIIQLNTISLQPPKASSERPTFHDYLIKEGASCTLMLSTLNKYHLLHRPPQSCRRWLWRAREQLVRRIKRTLSPQTYDYFSLLFLGNKQVVRQFELRNIFNRWGIAHYLARSGLHIALFIAIWQFIFRFLPLHLIIKHLLLLIMTLSYAALSWTSISFLRALIVFLFIQLGLITKSKPLSLHLLSLTCILTLLVNPMQLLFLDFQLSFSLTFALMMLTEHIYHTASTPPLKKEENQFTLLLKNRILTFLESYVTNNNTA